MHCSSMLIYITLHYVKQNIRLNRFLINKGTKNFFDVVISSPENQEMKKV